MDFLATQGNWLMEVPIFSVLVGLDWASLLPDPRISEGKGFHYMERYKKHALWSYQTLKAFSEKG